jgi:hypothetical protein
MAENFSDEVDASKKTLATESFASEWHKLLERAKKLLGDAALDAEYESVLRDLRKQVGHLGHRVVKEDDGILFATGDYNLGTGQLRSDANAKTASKAATIKLLRHLYMLRKAGVTGFGSVLCRLPIRIGRMAR